MKKVVFPIFCFFIINVLNVNAQDYTTAIGVRGGFAQGVTIKHFVSSTTAIEAIVTTKWKGFNMIGLYEIHAPAFDVDRLSWYYGVGGHVGFWDGKNHHPWFDDNKSHTLLGLDGIVGIEYTVAEIPFCFSLDWKPAFNFFDVMQTSFGEAALSIRFVF